MALLKASFNNKERKNRSGSGGINIHMKKRENTQRECGVYANGGTNLRLGNRDFKARSFGIIQGLSIDRLIDSCGLYNNKMFYQVYVLFL